MKLNYFLILVGCVLLAGCNSMYIKSGTVDKTQTVSVDRGGYTMRRSAKEVMEKRGYTVLVGRALNTREYVDGTGDIDIELETSRVAGARYAVKVRERRELFNPLCVFNGFWWWNFNVSIADNQSGKELFTWRGRGCANSSLRKLNRALDELEIK